MLKKLLKIFKWVTGILIALFLTITLLILVYEEDIKQYAVSKLNDHLKVPVKVEKIDLVFWSTFPYASLEFHNVFIEDAFPQTPTKDTLFSAENIYLKFSITDLWNDEYKVKKTLVENGQLHLKIDPNGDVNYDILKPSESEAQTPFEFELEDFILNKFDLKYSDFQAKQYYHLITEKTSLTGAFSETLYDMEVKGEYLVKKIQKGEVPFVKNQKSNIQLTLEVNQENNSYLIKNGQVSMGAMNFLSEGYIKGDSMSIQLSGDQIGIDDFVSTFQDENIRKARQYNGSGILNFNLGIRYDSSMTTSNIEATFDVSDGKLALEAQKISMSNLHFKGSYQNFAGEKEDELEISKVSGYSMNGGFYGKAKLVNTSSPKISMQIDGSFDLKVLHQLFFPDLARSMSGVIASEMDVRLHWGKEGFVVDKLLGNVHCSNVSASLEELPHPLNELNGDFSVNNEWILFQNLVLKYAHSDISGNGSIRNVFSGSNQKPIIVKTDLKANKIKVEDFYENNSSSVSNEPGHIFPQNLVLKASANIEVLEADAHTYENVKTDLTLSSTELYLYSLSLNHAKGSVRGNVKIKEHANQPFDIITHLKLQGINVKTLFKEWNNFSQTTIQAKNISGDLDANLNLYLPVTRDGNPILEDLEADIIVTLSSGVISQLPSLRSVTDYMREQKAVNLFMKKHINYLEKELMEIRFETLSNEIHIGQKKIVIPEMKIASSAIDLNLSGTHTFDNYLDYELDFRFRELKIDKSETEFGDVVDDGTGARIFMKMFGHVDSLEFSMDKVSKKESRKEKLENEKQTVKSMLKEDFGLYKKDSTIQEIEREKEPDPEFEYYEGVFEDTTQSDKKEEEKKKGFFKKFIEKSKKEQERQNQKEVEIDI